MANPFDDYFDAMQAPEEDDKRATCNRCGSAAVRWRQQGGRWVLFSLRPGVEHSCDVAGDFDDLTKGG